MAACRGIQRVVHHLADCHCLVLCGRRVSVGLLGVLVEVTLAVVPDYPVYRDLQVIRSVSHGFCHLGLDSPVSLHSWTRELP